VPGSQKAPLASFAAARIRRFISLIGNYNFPTSHHTEQHGEHRTAHPAEPGAAIAMNVIFISISVSLCESDARLIAIRELDAGRFE
jgi:hypothetical protein